ncbi:hypothetical protein PVK06_035188 [Gossypium arboreum]|uniref:Uncharacterized protein n=1 Tax=Gossypium arboreum TaxID=29729 RepID=A0ABR0NIA8_GOSAR|nr:hypothetical protein PVK06_035188 [Gossypium arboreum]
MNYLKQQQNLNEQQQEVSIYPNSKNTGQHWQRNSGSRLKVKHPVESQGKVVKEVVHRLETKGGREIIPKPIMLWRLKLMLGRMLSCTNLTNGGARAQVDDKRRNEELKIKEKAKKIRATGVVPFTCLCF